MELLHINKSNVQILKKFIDNLGSANKHFRYFNSRILDVVDNHLITLVLTENNDPIAYGHLDIEDMTVWLGIAVLPDYQGKGLGKYMMNQLIAYAQKESINEIVLTVDNDNMNAIRLYENFNFNKIEEFEKYSKFILYLK